MRGVVLAMVVVAVAAGALYLLVTRPAATPIAATSTVAAYDASVAPVMPADAVVETRDSSAREALVATLQSLRRSGPADEPWNAQAGDVFTALEHSATVSVVGCYVAGCGATLTFASASAYRAGLAQLEAIAAYRAWTGGKQITGLDVRPDGRVVVGLLLFRPD